MPKNAVSPEELKQRQALFLEEKEEFTAGVIESWYQYWDGKVYISFSGGKDSTVLLHQVRKIYPEVPAVFIDTGLEYPEIRSFVKTIDNVVWLRPKMRFDKIIEKYGYPVVSKETSEKVSAILFTKSDKYRSKLLYGDEKGSGKLSGKWLYLLDAPFKISSKCCMKLKKEPVKKYERENGNKLIIGTMAGDSRLRSTVYFRYGCNTFDSSRPTSRPLSIWKEENIWDYIHKYDLPYPKIYDMGYSNTGCMFCAFGVHMEKGENRFQRMARTHPKQYKYCMEKLGMAEVLDYIGVDYKPIKGLLSYDEINGFKGRIL